jgi:hypothetical protein
MQSRVMDGQRWLGLGFIVLLASPAYATFHLWEFNELYSNADGSVQFIELLTSFDLQQFTNGERIRAGSGTDNVVFVFPSNTPSPTGGHHLLLGTDDFAALSGAVTPDFILPDGFLFRPSGSVSFLGADFLSYTMLPTDGILSLNRNLTPGFNSPTNYAGQVGSIVPEPMSLTLLCLGAGIPLRRRPRHPIPADASSVDLADVALFQNAFGTPP